MYTMCSFILYSCWQFKTDILAWVHISGLNNFWGFSKYFQRNGREKFTKNIMDLVLILFVSR